MPNLQSLSSATFLAFVIVISLIAGTAGIVVVSRYVGPLPVSVTSTTTAKQSTFDVSGTSKITTVPDKVTVDLGITINEATVKAAQDKANTTINNVKDELQKLGIDKKDIKTENYNLYPNYDYQQGKGPKVTNYSVQVMLKVSFADFSKLNQAVDSATRVGANQIQGINFTLSDDKKAEVEKEARKQAIEEAKKKAQELASLSGMKLGKIVNISEGTANPIMPYADRNMLQAKEGMGGGAGAPTNIEPGSSSFEYTVTISYETL